MSNRTRPSIRNHGAGVVGIAAVVLGFLSTGHIDAAAAAGPSTEKKGATAKKGAPAKEGAPASSESPIAFRFVDGAENGTREILDRRKAEVTEKKGGKLGGHDWWLWGLTGIDYDRDGDTDLIVTIHGPAGHGVFLQS